MAAVSTSKFAFVDVYLLKDSLLPANAPTFRAGMSIRLVGYLDICLYIWPGSFSELIAAR